MEVFDDDELLCTESFPICLLLPELDFWPIWVDRESDCDTGGCSRVLDVLGVGATPVGVVIVVSIPFFCLDNDDCWLLGKATRGSSSSPGTEVVVCRHWALAASAADDRETLRSRTNSMALRTDSNE
jgi:hypothetical protein